MQRKYLGDAKDCFKWDYLHFLVEALGHQQLQIVWMMNPDDPGSDGYPPEKYPGDPRILGLCDLLRSRHDPELLADLPQRMAASYSVALYGSHEHMLDRDRNAYFADIVSEPAQCLFLDPDTGFEPRTATVKHVRYQEGNALLGRVAPGSVVTVYQNFTYVPFPEHLRVIRRRFGDHECSAVYSDSPYYSIMLMSMTTDDETTSRLREANDEYAKVRLGVKVLT